MEVTWYYQIQIIKEKLLVNLYINTNNVLTRYLYSVLMTLLKSRLEQSMFL